jgi:hypothetical protein
MKKGLFWAIGSVAAVGGLALLIFKPVWFVVLVGIGVVLFLAFILLVDYIGGFICKRR